MRVGFSSFTPVVQQAQFGGPFQRLWPKPPEPTVVVDLDAKSGVPLIAVEGAKDSDEVRGILLNTAVKSGIVTREEAAQLLEGDTIKQDRRRIELAVAPDNEEDKGIGYLMNL